MNVNNQQRQDGLPQHPDKPEEQPQELARFTAAAA
jgi:hypothetical protein